MGNKIIPFTAVMSVRSNPDPSDWELPFQLNRLSMVTNSCHEFYSGQDEDLVNSGVNTASSAWPFQRLERNASGLGRILRYLVEIYCGAVEFPVLPF